MIDEDGIRQRWEQMGAKLDERGRRLFAANEVQAAGHGALKIVSRITGLARSTINRGEDDIDVGPLANGRIRRKGGGGKRLSEIDPTLIPDLRRLVEPATLGSPVQPLTWVSKSRAKLAQALEAMGHVISANTVAALLATELGFSRQYNRKADEGSKHPDRNAQFEYINTNILSAQAEGQPVISVDTKKKELIGNYRNGGTDYRPEGKPLRVKVHDFIDKELGKVAPYGIYDVTANAGFVSLGITSDTAEFAVAAIRTWIGRIGWARYPGMRELVPDLIRDHGGLRRLEWCPRQIVENAIADPRRRDRRVAPRAPLSAGHVEMEQNRAPDVLLHHTELARTAPHRSRRRRRADRRDDNQNRPHRRVRPRRGDLRKRYQGQ